MSLAEYLAEGRVEAEALMTDTGILEYSTGKTTDDAGHVTDTYATRYEGACRVQLRSRVSQPQESAAQLVTLLQAEIQLPMSVAGVQIKDRLTVTASESDPDLVGRRFHVTDLFHKSHATARRLPCVEVTA